MNTAYGFERGDLFDHARGEILPVNVSQLEIAHKNDLFAFPKIGAESGKWTRTGTFTLCDFWPLAIHRAVEMERNVTPKQIPPTSAGETYMSCA